MGSDGCVSMIMITVAAPLTTAHISTPTHANVVHATVPTCVRIHSMIVKDSSSIIGLLLRGDSPSG